MVKGRPVTISRVEEVRDLVEAGGELDQVTREAVSRDLAQLLDLATTAPQRTEVRRRGGPCVVTTLDCSVIIVLCKLAAQING